MAKPCSTCVFFKLGDVMGRPHHGCMRSHTLITNRTHRPPSKGFSTEFERDNVVPKHRVERDKCGPQGLHHQERQS